MAATHAALLYGSYRVAEELGVYFTLHDDVVPDKSHPGWSPVQRLPQLRVDAAPTFSVRGLQPFHDFFRTWRFFVLLARWRAGAGGGCQ